MLYVPGQQITIRDGGIGLVNTATALPLVIGVTNGGSADTLYQYTNPNKLRDDHLSGPAVELALPCIQFAGGCLLLKTNASTAGSNGAVSPTRVGTSTGTVTLTGTPRDSYRAIIKITQTGTVSVGRFAYSLDGAYTYSDEYTIPASTFLIPGTGITATFVPGAGPTTFENGDLHSWTSTSAHYNAANLGTAATALLAQIGTRKVRKVFFAGRNSSASSAATIAAAAATLLAQLQSVNLFARGMIDGGLDTPANWKTSFSAFADLRLAVTFGDADIVTLNPMGGWGVPRYPALNAAAERAAVAQLSENLGRKLSGALRGVRAITYDEGANTQFAASDKVITLRSYRGQSGFYVTNGYLKSPTGSDFKYWDWGCTIDEMCETVFEAQDQWLLAKLRSKTDGTGNLDSRDAARVEQGVRQALKARLLDPPNVEGFTGHVSGLGYNVDRTNDYLSTQLLQSTGLAVPLSPVEGIATSIGFARSLT